MCYFMTATINPGIPYQYFSDISKPVSFGSLENNKEIKSCNKCNIYITPNSYTYHCDQCRICIEGKLINYIRLRSSLSLDF